VQKDLLDGVAGRVKHLDEGGYARVYRKNGKEYATHLQQVVGELLDSLEMEYRTSVPIFKGSKVHADFMVGEKLILVEKSLTKEERRKVGVAGRSCILVSRSALRSDILDDGTRIVGTGDDDGRLQTIFLDDPSFNFDYAHILPKTEKCSVMHGHTSSALVEIIGGPREGMVVDFNDAKPIIREAIADLDHKLFISSRYVTGEDRTHVELSFETVHGSFEMRVPRKTTVLLQGEATVENLALELLRRISPRMPENVEAVGVYVYEGLNKGTHLLATIHGREAERRRKP
jgi:6-pyruvoyltetrahydropterin/6-carboxytetrahydropterin synthase